MNKEIPQQSNSQKVAEKVRAHCANVAREELLDASMQGLCLEGAIEVALGAIKSIDLQKIIDEVDQNK